MPHYTLEQEARLRRLVAIHESVAEQKLHGEPCPLMLSQLYTLKVFSEELTKLVRQMIEATKERM